MTDQPSTIYRRTFLQLLIAVLLIFTVLALVYFWLFNLSSERIQQAQLMESAEVLAERVRLSMDRNHLDLTDYDCENEIMFAARANRSIVWVVNADGCIIVSTAMPSSALERLSEAAFGYPLLPEEYLTNEPWKIKGQSMAGSFHGLLPGDQRWISAQVALSSQTGAYGGEIILHRSLAQQSLIDFFTENVLVLALMVAFLLSILLFYRISRNITRPIAELVRVANQVYRGNLSARVRIPGLGEAKALKLAENESLESMQQEMQLDDLTLLMRLMNTLISKLEEREQERKIFLSSVSHDLRTPITSIRGFIDGMLDGTVPPERFPYYLEIVQKESQRLQNLIQGLFEIALTEKNDTLKLSVVDINELILQNIKGLEGVYREKELKIETDFFCERLEDEPCLKVLCDPEGIERVLTNILANAIRYSPLGGILAISTALCQGGSQIEVLVEDAGPGLPEEEQKKVFDLFYKVNKARGSGGSGLGLYIARNILSRHGQSIEAKRSERLGGACFRFTLDRPGKL